MTLSISVAVMAHPSRSEMVDDLLERLDAPATVVWDEIQDRHDTGVRSLEAFDPDCTHHMVIQDDALPCRDLVAGVTEALERVPEGHPFSGYIGRVKPYRAKINAIIEKAHADVSFIRMAGIYWGPCVVLPTAALPQLCPWFRGATGIENYDKRMSEWFKSQKLECWYSWPSLVDHRGDESLTHGHAGKRRAHHALAPEESALDANWSRQVLSMPEAEAFDRERQENARRAARKAERQAERQYRRATRMTAR